MNGGRQAHIGALHAHQHKNVLQKNEQTRPVRDGDHHGPQLAKQLLPFLHRFTPLVGTNIVQDLEEPGKSVRWNLDRHGHHVQDPTPDHPLASSLWAQAPGGRCRPLCTNSKGLCTRRQEEYN
jgi:hypothetical protein